MADVMLTLVRLAFVATILTVALEQIFDTRFYQKYFGKGLNGTGSRYFTEFELRPWISTLVGILIAFSFEIQAISTGLGSEFLSASGGHNPEAQLVDMVLTGLIIGGGTKSVKKIAKQFSATQQAVQKLKK